MKHLALTHENYEVSLLTDEEFVKYKSIIPKIEDWWWLRPAIVYSQKDADEKPGEAVIKFVSIDGNKNDLGMDPFYRIGVRPVIRCKTDELSQGDVFAALGNRWVVLDDGLAISLDTICHKRIDASAGYWVKVLKSKEDRSCELKPWLEEWAKDGEER